jgi:hypothetical protein
MSIFDFFKPRTEEVTIKQAKERLYSLEEEAKREREDGGLKAQLAEVIGDIRASLATLNGARLLNEKIPARERSIMEGNRRAYIDQVGYFLKTIPEEPIAASMVFKERIEGFLKSTFKGFQIMTQFFETEVSRVASDFKRMEQVLGAAGELCAKQIEIEECKGVFDEIDGIKEKKRRRKEKLALLKESQVLKDAEIKKNLENIDTLKQSSDYKNLLSMQRDEGKALESIHLLQSEIHQRLAIFSKLFRKFHNLRGERLSAELANSPVEAFIKSPEEVLDVLKELASLVEREQISEKADEKRKMLERLNGFDREGLLSRRKELLLAMENLSNIQRKIADNSSLMKFEGLLQQNGLLGKEMEALAEQLNTVAHIPSTEELRGRLEERLSKLSKKRVVLVGSL